MTGSFLDLLRADGRPLHTIWYPRGAVQCRSALEDSSWLFLIWKDGHLERFHFPPIGESVRIPFSPPPTAL
jgi:hypothetical protein